MPAVGGGVSVVSWGGFGVGSGVTVIAAVVAGPGVRVLPLGVPVGVPLGVPLGVADVAGANDDGRFVGANVPPSFLFSRACGQ